MSNLNKHLKTLEKLIFYTMLAVSVGSLFYTKVFHTLDGPSHVENAQIMLQLLFGDNELINSHYKFNPILVPNIGGHLVLMGLLCFVDGLTAVKLFLALYVIGFSLLFRAIIKIINPDAIPWLSPMVFIFVFHILFALGFFNFTLGGVFVLAIVYTYLSNKEKQSYGYYITLSILFVCLFLCHFFTWFIGLYILGFLFLLDNLSFNLLKGFFSKALKLGLAILPSLILMLYAMLSRDGYGTPIYRPWNETISNLYFAGFIDVFAHEPRSSYIKVFAYIFWISFILTFIYQIVCAIKQKTSTWIQNNQWLFVCIILMALYLFLPDGDGTTGLTAPRFSLYIFILATFWFAKQSKIGNYFSLFFIPISIVLLNGYNKGVIETNTWHSDIINEYLDAEKLLEPNTVILPMRFPAEWWQISTHYQSYFTLNSNRIILDNYECASNYFPLVYNREKIPTYTLSGKPIPNFCLEYPYPQNNPSVLRKVDYIAIINKYTYGKNECMMNLLSLTNGDTINIFRGKHLDVYKLYR